MKRKITSLITALMLVFTYISVLAEDTDEQYSWDLTALTASDYNADSYVALDSIFSVKSDPSYVTTDGIKAKKNNDVRIKIEAVVGGELTVSFRGEGSVILPDYENRKGGEENITTDVPVTLTKGTTYYLQASTGDSAVITAVKFVPDEPVPVSTPSPQETTEPTNTDEPLQTTEPTETSTPAPTQEVEPTATPKPTAPEDMVFDKSWDLTTLTAENYNADSYTAIDEVVSVKSASEYVTTDGVKVSKSNNARIKIIPEADGQIMLEFSGSVVMPNYENRKGGEVVVGERELIDVYAGVEYYVQGSSGTAAVVKAIHFKEKTFELFSVTGIGFNEDYTKLLEFDIEKGDDYEHDMVACLCVYDADGVLKKVGIRKILANSLVIGTNTVKCDIDITGYDSENDKVKIFLLTSLD